MYIILGCVINTLWIRGDICLWGCIEMQLMPLFLSRNV